MTLNILSFGEFLLVPGNLLVVIPVRSSLPILLLCGIVAAPTLTSNVVLSITSHTGMISPLGELTGSGEGKILVVIPVRT